MRAREKGDIHIHAANHKDVVRQLIAMARDAMFASLKQIQAYKIYIEKKQREASFNKLKSGSANPAPVNSYTKNMQVYFTPDGDGIMRPSLLGMFAPPVAGKDSSGKIKETVGLGELFPFSKEDIAALNGNVVQIEQMVPVYTLVVNVYDYTGKLINSETKTFSKPAKELPKDFKFIGTFQRDIYLSAPNGGDGNLTTANEQRSIDSFIPPAKEEPAEPLENASTAGTRAWGALTAVGGILEALGGAVLGIATSETVVGAVAGWAAVVQGLDIASAGLTQLFTGRNTQSFTEKGISKGLQTTGVSKENADMYAAYTSDAMSIALTAGTAAMSKAPVYLATEGKIISSEGITDAVKDVVPVGGNESVPEGSFSIWNWEGYPKDIPKPIGPFRVLKGEQYEVARKAANIANKKLSKELELIGKKVDIHELKPVKFGGSPTDINNKVFLDRTIHQTQLNPFWYKIYTEVK